MNGKQKLGKLARMLVTMAMFELGYCIKTSTATMSLPSDPVAKCSSAG